MELIRKDRLRKGIIDIKILSKVMILDIDNNMCFIYKVYNQINYIINNTIQ